MKLGTVPSTFKGILFPGGRQAILADTPKRELKSDEVRVRINASGICGTDLHRYRWSVEERAAVAHFVTGHEPIGVIAELGEAATGWTVGQRVVAFHTFGCTQQPRCELSLRPGSLWCEHGAVMGLNTHGANAEYFTAPVDKILPLPDDFSDADGVLLACNFGTAWSAAHKAGVHAGSRLLVTGSGPVGLCAIMIAKSMGAHVSVLEISAERREFALSAGADAVLTGADEFEMHSFHAAIDTTGAESVVVGLVSALAPRGTIVLVGLGSAQSLGYNRDLIVKEVTVKGSLIFRPDEWPHVLQSYRACTPTPASLLVTHIAHPRDADKAFRQADHALTGKVVFDWTVGRFDM